MSDNVKAQIILKEKHDQQEVALSPVHVYSSNAHDSRYQGIHCPVMTKFQETAFDMIESISFDGKTKTFTYSTEKKRKAAAAADASTEPGFVLKVTSKDWCPVRIRCNSKETEGEVMFVRPMINSFDGNMKFLYSVVLFMDQESPKVQERVDAQKESYRHTTWIGCDMLRLIERRIRLEEFCRQIEEHKRLLMWLDDSSSDDSDDNMPDLPN